MGAGCVATVQHCTAEKKRATDVILDFGVGLIVRNDADIQTVT